MICESRLSTPASVTTCTRPRPTDSGPPAPHACANSNEPVNGQKHAYAPLRHRGGTPAPPPTARRIRADGPAQRRVAATVWHVGIRLRSGQRTRGCPQTRRATGAHIPGLMPGPAAGWANRCRAPQRGRPAPPPPQLRIEPRPGLHALHPPAQPGGERRAPPCARAVGRTELGPAYGARSSRSSTAVVQARAASGSQPHRSVSQRSVSGDASAETTSAIWSALRSVFHMPSWASSPSSW